MDKNIKNTIQNKQTTTEAGRSMVEMLGVLAVIGVLSIGGIAGYTYAMNKYHASEILSGISQRAVVASQQMILSGTPSLVEYAGQQIGDYGVALSENDYGDSFFGIQVSGIEQAVCEHLQDQWLSNATDIYLGDSYLDKATCAEGNNNTITFVFNDALNGSDNADGGDGKDVGVCDNGNVYLSYMDDPCSTDTPDDMECTKNSDCDDGEFCLLASNQSGNDILPHFGNCEPIGAVSVSNGLLSTSEVTYWSWWSAENWCKAQGTRLAKINDIDNLLDYCPKDEEDPDSCEDFLRELFGEVRRFWLGDFNSDGVYRISALSKTAPVSPSTQGYSPLCISNQ